MPLKPSAPTEAPAEGGRRIWKVRSTSGVLRKAASAALPKIAFWSGEMFEAALMMPKMTPWSSLGASSFGENWYIGIVKRLKTIHTAYTAGRALSVPPSARP